jgi:transmembrane sensor
VDELSPQLRQALSRVGPRWSAQRSDHTWRGLQVRRARRTIVRSAAAATAVLAVSLFVAVRSAPPSRMAQSDRGAARSGDRAAASRLKPVVKHLRVDLGHGVTVERAGAGAEIEVAVQTPDTLAVRVVRGRNEFRVRAGGRRRVLVAAGDVEIAAYSTRFSVARFDAVVEVWTERGHLRVEQAGQTRRVEPGQRVRLALAERPVGQVGAARPDDSAAGPATAGQPTVAAALDMEPLVLDRTADRPAPAREPERRRTADRGEFRGHPGDGVLRADSASVAPLDSSAGSDAAALMAAADDARTAGRPLDAVARLREVVGRFPKDVRAPLAAFTAGRVLLDDLGRAKDAAVAFQRARELEPRGPLAEDALAREADAWSAFGDSDRTRVLAREYLERYPGGHRATAMRKYLE